MPALNNMLSLVNFSLHNLLRSPDQPITCQSLLHLSELGRHVIRVAQLGCLCVIVECSVILIETTVCVLDSRKKALLVVFECWVILTGYLGFV